MTFGTPFFEKLLLRSNQRPETLRRLPRHRPRAGRCGGVAAARCV